MSSLHIAKNSEPSLRPSFIKMSLDGVHHGVNIQDELQRVLDEDQHYDIMFTSMNEAFTRPGDDPGDTAYGVHTLLRRASIFAQIDYEHHTIIKFTVRALQDDPRS